MVSMVPLDLKHHDTSDTRGTPDTRSKDILMSGCPACCNVIMHLFYHVPTSRYYLHLIGSPGPGFYGGVYSGFITTPPLSYFFGSSPFIALGEC